MIDHPNSALRTSVGDKLVRLWPNRTWLGLGLGAILLDDGRCCLAGPGDAAYIPDGATVVEAELV